MRGDFYAISETDQLFGITGKRAADQNSGICKAGKSGKEDVLTVLLNEQDILSGKEVTLYLQRESGEQPLGEMKSDRGEVSGEMRIPGKKEREPILGVRIPLEENIEIIGQFVKGGVAKKASTPETDRQPWEQTKKRQKP